MIADLPATYVKHLLMPRGIGDLPDAHAVGEVGSMVGGLGVRISLRYAAACDGAARVASLYGRAFGSAAALPVISWLAETVRDQGWDEACALSHRTVLAGLGEGRPERLPPAVGRAAEFAVRALRRALGVAARGLPSDPEGAGILVCRCLGVGDRAIRAAVRAGAHDPESVGRATSACTGCRSCRPDVLALIEEEARPPLPPPPEHLPPLVRVALARAGPILRGLGMPLLGASARQDHVILSLGTPKTGAAISAPGALAIARHVLREVLGEAVRVDLAPPPDSRVTNP